MDALSVNRHPTIQDYVKSVSEYVLQAPQLTAGRSKQAQIALSAALGRALSDELVAQVPRIRPHPGELNVAGALRNARADVSEAHTLDGLRLAVEIKPINLAVGRALWNRFGDIRSFAVNIHLKFPFAVVGGVLAVPTWEWKKITKTMAAARLAAEAAAREEWQISADSPDDNDETLEGTHQDQAEEDINDETEVEALAEAGSELYKSPTVDLIQRLIRRLRRTRRRDTEADPAHLLEAIAVIVYDPDTGLIHDELPPQDSGLRWNDFISMMADTYDVRFED